MSRFAFAPALAPSLALVATLLVHASAWGCSCVSDPRGLLSEQAANQAVRLTVPVEHRMRPDGRVETRHRVLDPLGLPFEASLTTLSYPQDGGSCGYTPTLGTVQAVTTFDDGDALWTGGCSGLNAAFLGHWQTTRDDMRIPHMLACSRPEDDGRHERRTREAWSGDPAVIAPDPDNPGCEIYRYKDGPLHDALQARLDAAKAAAQAMPGLLSTPPQLDVSGDGMSVFAGLPLHADIDADGQLRGHILVMEDFGRILPEIVTGVFATSDTVWSEEIEVGVPSVFVRDARGRVSARDASDFGYDPVAYRILMGEPVPAQCEARPADEDYCEAAEDAASARIGDSLRFANEYDDVARLGAALNALPTRR